MEPRGGWVPQERCGQAIKIHNLRELGPATANPGDAHVKVGSERESATSDSRANFGWIEIGLFGSGFAPRGPSKIGRRIGNSSPKKIPILRWDLALPVLAVVWGILIVLPI